MTGLEIVTLSPNFTQPVVTFVITNVVSDVSTTFEIVPTLSVTSIVPVNVLPLPLMEKLASS